MSIKLEVTVSEDQLIDVCRRELAIAPKADDSGFITWLGAHLDAESVDPMEVAAELVEHMSLADRLEVARVRDERAFDVLRAADLDNSDVVSFVAQRLSTDDLLDYADAPTDDVADWLEGSPDMQVIRRADTIADQLDAIGLTPAKLCNWLQANHPDVLPKQNNVADVPTLALIKELMDRASKENDNA